VAKKLRVLVIDDSAYNRRTIVEMLESSGEVAVVATAADGEEGLKQALALKPDVIVLDLEMPHMDGFTFMKVRFDEAAIPVIVTSGFARRSDVFKALELGAFDFVAKPARHFSPETRSVRDELVAKVSAVRLLKRGAMTPVEVRRVEPLARVAVIGASTGGPPALQRLLSSLPGDLPLGLVIAQHMPERFTRAFAERLDRMSAFDVSEANDGDLLKPGAALVAPGGKNLQIVLSAEGAKVRLVEVSDREKFVPSIDLLFESAAKELKARAVGVLLTGMGCDGREGMRALKAAGALTLAESEESAVIFGMPKEAIAAGAVSRVLSLRDIADELIRLGRGG